MLQQILKIISIRQQFDTRNDCQRNITLLSKLTVASKVLEGAEHRINVYTPVHDDSSTESTQQFTATMGLGKKSIAFTLLELIVTCSIIAAIALISIPVYSKYRMRAKVAAMVSSASAAQFAVANDYFNRGYTFSNTTFAANSQPYLVPHANFISSISVEEGSVSVIGNPDYLGNRQIDIVLQPNVENNNITWTCYISDAAYFEYAPENCRNEAP